MSGMSDTPADTPDVGGAVEVPAEWEGMTPDQKDAAAEEMLLEIADKAGVDTGAEEPPADDGDDTPPPRTFTLPAE
jgi:hypothetical protein